MENVKQVGATKERSFKIATNPQGAYVYKRESTTESK